MGQAFKHAIHEFLNRWRLRADYQGALLTGSVATNTADSGSDIDLRILYTADADLYEVGEYWLAGKAVSFLGTTAKNYQELFYSDLQTTSKFEIRRFSVGQVLEESTPMLSQLKELATDLLSQPISGFSEQSLLVNKMKLSRKYKVLLEMPVTDTFFSMAYYDLLGRIFQLYAKHLQTDIPAFIKKKSRYFTNENYRKVHHFSTFPDKKFVKLYTSAAKKICLPTLEQIYQHVLINTGGFPDTDFVVRFSDSYREVNVLDIDTTITSKQEKSISIL